MQNIECIYYINIEYRNDRKELFLKTMEELGVDVSSEKIQRINAVYVPELGALGCTKSHILALETFLKTDQQICLILEDDFTYKNKETFWSDIQRIFDLNIKFDIIQLSYNHIYNPHINCILHDTEYTFLKRAQKTISSSSYIITRVFAPILLKNLYESSILLKETPCEKYALDSYWYKIQSDYLWYCISPSIGLQRASYSDVQHAFMDYGV